MATIVAFSPKQFIVVEGDVQEVNEKLGASHRTASGLCQLTRVSGKFEASFDPTSVLVNPDRVAYIHAVID